MFSVKELVEAGGSFQSVPSNYVFPKSTDDDCLLSEEEIIPTIDVSLLTSDSAKQRSKIVHALGNACREWGFFMVINHGVPKTLRDEMIRAGESFFDLSKEEKQEYAGKKLFDPIKWGTSFNVKVDKTYFWRDYLKVHVHPQFNAPQKPHGFSETAEEFCKRCRELASDLLKGISESLGLEESYIEKKMDIESGSNQILVVNLYPPCPQPEDAMGLPPHSDHGLLTILMQNELRGLQIQHNGKWVPINPPPDSFIVNIADHMEILTNGKYKSVVHRAVVNGKATRVSVGIAHGPQLDSVVSPAPKLLKRENMPALYRGITYRKYLELQQSNHLNGKSCLSHVRIRDGSFHRETTEEFCKRCRELASDLLKGIFKSLGLEESHIEKKMDIESGSNQILVVNLYPPCPQPEDAMGLPSHSDHGLLTILMQNELRGLQIQHNRKWVPINPPPYSFIVNVANHMEILTNGKYKSVVNGKAARVSVEITLRPRLRCRRCTRIA